MITKIEQLPPSDCPHGYPVAQLEQVLDEQQSRRLMHWMYGQTMTLCEGRFWDEETKEYVADECGPPPRGHGAVIYTHDLERFLRAGPIID